MFPTTMAEIYDRINGIEPRAYANTRNYGDGRVTRLSPYISRGVLSTRGIYEHVMTLPMEWEDKEKLVQELAWRDYWQLFWLSKKDDIFRDLKNAQADVEHQGTPAAVLSAKTGIQVVDRAIEELYQTGYMHNHMRMYVASICCNIGHAQWLNPARWMYAHLLDGDLASNHLSWQWVAGTFSKKKYVANQENINRFFHSDQRGTFLDVSYAELPLLPIPSALKEASKFDLNSKLPDPIDNPKLNNTPTLLYNYYNLDPNWHTGSGIQRVLLLEPNIFAEHPVTDRCINFMLQLALNIPDIKVYVGSFEELNNIISSENIRFKEHPLNEHYIGQEESREWISSIRDYYPSFFAFWKRCKKELRS